MKKMFMIFSLISSVAVLLILAAIGMSGKLTPQAETNGQQQWLTPEVIQAEQIEEQVKKELKKKEIKTVYTMKYQKAAQKQVDAEKKKHYYTLQEPLLILNPYGTNRTGLYIYFEHSERVNVEYEVSVKEEEIAPFNGKLYTNMTGMPLSEQEGQIIGLLPGRTNYVLLYLYDQEHNLVGREGYKIDVPDYGTVKEIKLAMEQSRNENQLTDGLYCLFGYDRRNGEEPGHMLFYDNEGVLRAEIPIADGMQDSNIEQIDSNILYLCSNEKMVLVNRLGKVEKIFNLGDKYVAHHDFEVVETLDKVIVLADQRSKGTKEDIVLSVDLYTGKIKKILDFEKLMPEIRERARITKDCPDQDYVDWLHFNTVSAINEKDILLSSRETSTIMRVNNVFGKKPKIAWLIAEESVWEGTKYEKLLLKKEGNFASQAGQHTTTYMSDPALGEGQYYIHMFNNNYGGQHSYPEQNWSVIPGVGLPGKDAEYSYYYRYLVDENAGTYQLVQEFGLPYSSIVSSTQHYKENIVTCSGNAGVFEEYNADGKRIARYFMDVDPFTYRVFKYDMKGYWFANE